MSRVSDLKKSIISLDIARLNKLPKKEEILFLKRLKEIAKTFYRFRVLGQGALSLCYLAQGYFDAYCDLTSYTKIVDIGAGLVIAQEAGAKITDLNGKFPKLNTGYLVVSNGKIHNQLLELLDK